MLNSTLLYPNRLGERGEAEHNPSVAYLLSHAYSCLRRARYVADAYEGAYAFAKACFVFAMSKRQSMRVHYALGSASLGLGRDSEGIAELNEAIERAAELPDPGAYAELAYLASAASANLFCFHAAAEYATISLGILRFLAEGQASVDAEFEINVLVALASSEFALARYEPALEHLQMARHLSSLLPHKLSSIGAIAWMESLLFRWRGQPELALHHALAAADIYTQTADSPSSWAAVGRLSGIVTEIALDTADNLPNRVESGARFTYVQLARTYVKRALQKAQETNDMTGLSVASLAQARYDSVAGRNVDRKHMIEGVIQRAQHDNDKVLLAQAYTTLGREYTVLGEPEASLDCYRRTLKTLEGTEVPAMGVFAQRGFLLAREMQE